MFSAIRRGDRTLPTTLQVQNHLSPSTSWHSRPESSTQVPPHSGSTTPRTGAACSSPLTSHAPCQPCCHPKSPDDDVRQGTMQHSRDRCHLVVSSSSASVSVCLCVCDRVCGCDSDSCCAWFIYHARMHVIAPDSCRGLCEARLCAVLARRDMEVLPTLELEQKKS